MRRMRHRTPDSFLNVRVVTIGLVGLALSVCLCLQTRASAQQTAPQVKVAQSSPSTGAAAPVSGHRQVIDRYCVTCHNQKLKTAGLMLDEADIARPAAAGEVWEKVVRKLHTSTMPPPNMPQPSIEERRAVLSWLETSLDQAAAAKPNPGRTDTLRRLNRTEYQNAIRDLLLLDIDANSLLPPDESGHGFDNVTVGDLPPALLDRYILAAQKISRLAIGSLPSLESDIIRVPPDLTQEEHVEGLPIGTRGGVSVRYTFAQDGEYDIQVYLARGYSGNIDGLRDAQPHEMKVLLDRTPIGTITVQKPADGDDSLLDKNFKIRVPVKAGPHDVGVTFVRNSSSLLETARQPLQAHFNERRHPRLTPGISQFSITGPYAARITDDTPSRRRIFVCRPAAPREEEACAKKILSTLMRRAYHRSISEADVERPMAFYREGAKREPDRAKPQGRSDGDFDAGIARALSLVLFNPGFLFRVEADPAGAAAGTAYRISDLELASRLSFLLWSSIPDDELLDAAIRGELRRPDVLEKQARRMLADPRSYNLASNFSGQWLRLRNLTSVDPNVRLYPDFDDNLRQAFRQETELFVDSIRRNDRSVLDLLKADYTFLNERLAKHYGIPHVYGSRFRRVALDAANPRGGLLRQGSILTVTSYATRTSPVIRGKWILENLLGTPPPPPLPNVPALKDNTVSATLSVRQRLSEHRANAVCASCHRLMDPAGFSLENYDAIGRWRSVEEGQPIDATGGLPDGSQFTGVSGLEKGLRDRP